MSFLSSYLQPISIPDCLLRSKNNPVGSGLQGDPSQSSNKEGLVGKDGDTEQEVNSNQKVHDSTIVTGENVEAIIAKDGGGSERRIGWKKLARKQVVISPNISPNSGLKRKEVGSEECSVGVHRQGVAQKLKLMAHESSDHSPIMVRVSHGGGKEKIKAGVRRFFFETGWADLVDCEAKIKEGWSWGNGPISLHNTCGKLEKTGLILKEWSKKSVPNFPAEIKSLQEQLEKLDEKWETKEDIDKRQSLISKLNELLDLEEKKWKQRKGNEAAHQCANWMKHCSVDRGVGDYVNDVCFDDEDFPDDDEGGRQLELAERLLALSATIPGSKKKMDNNSILDTASHYVKQLQQRVRELEQQVECNTSSNKGTTSCTEVNSYEPNEHILPEVKVRVLHKEVLVIIHCENQKGIMLKILAKLENLHLSIVNSSVLPFGRSTLDITIIAQVHNDF
ncbi:hypothetical protein RIF29_28586 [Crotalaria pallida]|uniref:Plant bHLH transcription factor ACT-like domain-containing protein n=1 Tax=Crotalaria pallida TaxID=3830 RepID=A0AAN9ECX7_CROPI